MEKFSNFKIFIITTRTVSDDFTDTRSYENLAIYLLPDQWGMFVIKLDELHKRHSA